jgi:hypothetical protein
MVAFSVNEMKKQREDEVFVGYLGKDLPLVAR